MMVRLIFSQLVRGRDLRTYVVENESTVEVKLESHVSLFDSRVKSPG